MYESCAPPSARKLDASTFAQLAPSPAGTSHAIAAVVLAKHRRALVPATMVALLLLPLGAMTYKLGALGYELGDVLPRTRWRVTIDMTLDGHDRDVRVRTFLPIGDARQTIGDEQNESPGLRFQSDAAGVDREALWTGAGVPDGTRIRFAYDVLSEPVSYVIDPALEVPALVPSSVAVYLRPEPQVQVDSPEISRALAELGADRGPLLERLRKIYAFTSGMPQRPFKGNTDALTALRLREASCNGKSRLFVALARAAGIPSRLVGGLVLDEGSKRTSHQWVETYVAGHWVPFCPTNHHFAAIPASYLSLYHGDEALFRHTSDINFDYRFTMAAEMVPSPRAKESFSLLNVWALFERLRLPYSLLRTILMLPIGALVVVVFRNVIGLPTFGTFLPALIAAAAGETGPFWGVVAVLLLVLVVAVVRWGMARFELLHSPTLAILLAAVAVAILGTSLLAEHLGLGRLARITMFPLAVMAITAERFYLSLSEHGGRSAAKELAGTLAVMLACYVVMNSLALQVLVIGFPEVLLFVVAADVYLGRWVGVRLSEYLRFRALLGAGAAR